MTDNNCLESREKNQSNARLSHQLWPPWPTGPTSTSWNTWMFSWLFGRSHAWSVGHINCFPLFALAVEVPYHRSEYIAYYLLSERPSVRLSVSLGYSNCLAVLLISFCYGVIFCCAEAVTLLTPIPTVICTIFVYVMLWWFLQIFFHKKYLLFSHNNRKNRKLKNQNEIALQLLKQYIARLKLLEKWQKIVVVFGVS